MANISGCYRWNDSLTLAEKGYLFEGRIVANGMIYTEMTIVPAEDGTTMIALFEEDGNMALVYFSESGWIGAVSIYDERPIIAESDLWQTWDFGEGQEISDDLFAYLTANATQVASAEAVCLSYDGRIIASVDGGQRATLLCGGKSMNSDLLILVPKKKISASGGGAELNVAFGNAAPDDTSKLWIKTAEPEALAVKLNLDFVGNEKMNTAVCRLPNNVYHATAAAIGRKIYIFGGGGSSIYTDRVHVYDVDTNTARQLDCTLPYDANGAAAVTVGEKIYIFGGQGSSGNADTWKSILVFHPATETFETLDVLLPEKRYLAAAAAVGKRIYLFGGSYPKTTSGQTVCDSIYLFNTESNAITKLSSVLPAVNFGATAVAVGSVIYIFGGAKSNTSFHKTICRFDTESNTISTLGAVLPNVAYEAPCAAVGSMVYIFGGVNSTGGLNTICRFNSLTEKLEVLDETSAKNIYATPCAAIGSKIYVFDGYSGSTDHNVNTFVVNIDLPENHVLIEAGGSGDMMRLFPNLEIGVKNVYLGNADGKGEKVPAAVYKDGAWVEI